MKRIILAAVTAVSIGAAEAQLYSGDSSYEYCQLLGQLATALAEERDAGATIDKAYREIAELIHDDAYAMDARIVAETVHTYPRLSPTEEGNLIYNHCRGNR